jgi:hypothetical protein
VQVAVVPPLRFQSEDKQTPLRNHQIDTIDPQRIPLRELLLA